MIGREIRTILKNDSDVFTAVSGRIYADLASQDDPTLPYIVYRIADRIREHSQDPAGVDIYRVEFFIHAADYATTQEIEKRIDGALDRYAVGTIVNGFIMDGIAQDSSEDDPYDIDNQGNRSKITEYRVRVKEVDEGFIYAMSETETGRRWIDGSIVYTRVWYFDSAGTYDLISKDWTWVETPKRVEWIGSGYDYTQISDITEGATNWEVAADGEIYIHGSYIK